MAGCSVVPQLPHRGPEHFHLESHLPNHLLRSCIPSVQYTRQPTEAVQAPLPQPASMFVVMLFARNCCLQCTGVFHHHDQFHVGTVHEEPGSRIAVLGNGDLWNCAVFTDSVEIVGDMSRPQNEKEEGYIDNVDKSFEAISEIQ